MNATLSPRQSPAARWTRQGLSVLGRDGGPKITDRRKPSGAGLHRPYNARLWRALPTSGSSFVQVRLASIRAEKISIIGMGIRSACPLSAPPRSLLGSLACPADAG